MKRHFLSILLLLVSTTVNCSIPIVDIGFYGYLGNNLWQYCIGKIIAEELGYNCHCPAIYGFPDTYVCPSNAMPRNYRTQLVKAELLIDIPSVVRDKTPRNIRLEGFFQQYEYLKKYSEKIRKEWLRIDQNLMHPAQHPDDVVVHIRCGESGSQYPGFVGFDYYKKALSMMSYRRVIICTDEPNHPFIKNFAPYNPIIHSTRSLTNVLRSGCNNDQLTRINFDEFAYMLSFNKIICSYSTFSWWVGFLSNAQEIYMPHPDGTTNYYSYGKIEESRYHYIHTRVGRQ